MSIKIYAANEINEQLVSYILNEAQYITKFSQFEIENYADREFQNPEVIEYLSNSNIDNTVLSGVSDTEKLALSFEEDQKLKFKFPDIFGLRAKKLKKKVRKIFCEVISALQNNDTIDWAAIVTAILTALIPAFAGGIPALVLPIIIALLAILMKYGMTAACPTV